MKLCAFIMASLVLWLSCVPCSEAAYTANAKAKAEISKFNNQQEHNDTDNCSPFCTCNCCFGFTLAFFSCQIENPIFPADVKTLAYLPAKISEIALPVWQPPQLPI